MSLQHIIFDTLYSKSSKGKLLEWTIEVERNRFRTISGEVGRTLTKSGWTECEGKNIGKANETSGEVQAVKEAEAKFTKKTEKGYCLDKDKAGELGYFSPMLAHTFSKQEAKIKYSCFSQPKLDGIRCVATKDGLFTRNGKDIVACPHIWRDIEHLVKDGLVLDGELYNHDLKDDFDKIVSLVKRQNLSSEQIEESAQNINFVIFDAYFPDEPRLSFAKRYFRLTQVFGESNCQHSYILHTDIVESKEELDALYADYLEKGFEGQIIRNNSPYENKRSYGLQKRKEFIDEEFKILDVLEGTGNRSGMAGKLVLQGKSGTFEAGIRGGFEFYERLLTQKKQIIGKKATIRYQNLTPAGVPRFPVCIAIRDYE